MIKVKEKSEKAGLKLNIQKTNHFMANREKVQTVTNFIFLGSRITADGDCSHEIKRRLLLGRKAMTKLDSVLKSRDIILPTKFHIVTAMVFLVVIYGCEIWNIKKAEHLRTRILSNCSAEEDS